MRIGIDARPLSYRLTGIGIYLKYLLDEIQRMDTENYYCLISSAPINYNIRNPNWSSVEGRFKTKLVSTLWLQLKVPLIAAKKNLDLFWGPRHQLPVFLPERVKTVLTVHDIVHRLYPETMALPNLLSERAFFRLSLLRSDAIIADSRSTTSGIRRFYKTALHKIETIYPGIPFPSENSTHNGELNLHLPSRYFLFVGTLDPRKNFERLFKAFDMIGPERHEVHLLIVGGEGWKNQSFRKRIKLHTLNGHVHLTGYVPRDCLESLYRKALCLVFPSLYEGFGFPILEAMFCGTPVITSNTSSMLEVAGNAALLVDPRNENAMAEAMCKMINNVDLRNHLSVEGLKRVKLFSWKYCAEETIRVFRKVLKR
jgi:glycosyltransferase involved in cell wall biosynthesis